MLSAVLSAVLAVPGLSVPGLHIAEAASLDHDSMGVPPFERDNIISRAHVSRSRGQQLLHPPASSGRFSVWGGEGFPLAQQLSNSPCGRPVASSSATPCVMHTAEKYPHVFRAKLFTLAEGPQWGPQYAVVLEGGLYPSLSYSAPHAVAGLASTHP